MNFERSPALPGYRIIYCSRLDLKLVYIISNKIYIFVFGIKVNIIQAVRAIEFELNLITI